MGTSAVRRVGIIGLGKMGHPMPRHLARAKFEVTGYDIDAHARSQAQQSGIALADNPRVVAERSDFVIIVVGFDSEAEAVLLGRDGIAGAGRRGLIVGIASTVAPSTMARLAARLADTGIVLLDMPLTRGEPAAEAREPRLSSRASRRLRAAPAVSFISVSSGRGRSARWSTI